MEIHMSELPSTGYLRLAQIIGSKKTSPPIPALIPICSSSWWNGIAKGIYPSPYKLSANVTAWKVEDIRALIDQISNKRVGEA
jgi:prophage regulatory protein